MEAEVRHLCDLCAVVEDDDDAYEEPSKGMKQIYDTSKYLNPSVCYSENIFLSGIEGD